MEPLKVIQKYYKENSSLYNILLYHSMDVMNKALNIVDKHPELNVDVEFLTEACLLHDIGIFMTNAPNIECNGILPYMCHGYIGREILEEEGYPKHALVCERHIGIGLTKEDIIAMKIPIPQRDMSPKSIEEKIISFADCFYSKSQLGKEKTVSQVLDTISKYNNKRSSDIFKEWCDSFL